MANTLKFGNGNWATKEDSVLAYNDENNNFKPLPFDFTRASTATYVDSDGLIKTSKNGEARIDYTDSTDGALLLEPARTNIILRSQEFDNDVSWIKSRATVTANNVVSPDGTLNADKLIETSDSGLHALSQNTTVASGTIYTFSIFIKKGSSSLIQFLFGTNNVSGNPYVNFDVNNGLLQNNGATSANIENYGNGWYRCCATFTTSVTAFTNFISPIQSISSGRASAFAGNVNNNIYIYGAQLEQGSYPTSYIPTSGSAVTRVAESCDQNPVTGIIGQTELTVFYQGIVERLGGSDGHAIALSQSANAIGSSRILLYRDSGNGNMYLYIQDSTTQFSTPLLVNSNPQINDKYAIAVKDNDLVVYCNGVKIAENTSGTIPATEYICLNKWNNTTYEQSKIKDVRLYNTRLSNAELATLTT
tara:strand:+ start:4956 stop:6212 length:1257 start_codon:yes stop_codon:yes gene_type:complete